MVNNHTKIYQAQSGYNYTYLLSFEESFFDTQYCHKKRDWFTTGWLLSLVFSVIYIIFIKFGEKIMEKREKFNLRLPLIVWNLLLAVFSTMGAIRMWPEFIYILKDQGFKTSICGNTLGTGVTTCWLYYFVLSKAFELLDTAFVILRKQKLLFLHWYHHATVLIYTWFSAKDLTATGRWFAVMNYTIHAFMYTYYAFRAMKYQIPKAISIAITCGQISQMIIGIYINYEAFIYIKNGEECAVPFENITVSFLIYATYFLLFCDFFNRAYLKIRSSTARSEKSIKSHFHSE